MSHSHRITTLLLAAGFSAFSFPALAQSSGTSSGSGATRETPPAAPSGTATGVSTNRNSSTSGSGVTSGSDASSPRSDSVPSGQGGSNFEGLDANGDGRVSLSEFTSPSGSSSRSFDRDNESTGGRSGASTGVDRTTMSGTGTAGESPAQYTTEHFRKLDRDGDGYLSRNELNAAKRNSTGGTAR
jgi:hypothetical protein